MFFIVFPNQDVNKVSKTCNYQVQILSSKRIKEPTAIFGRIYLLSAVVEAVNQEQIAVFLGQVAGFLKCTRHVIVI